MLYQVTLNGVVRGQFEADDSAEALRLARVGFSEDIRSQEAVEVATLPLDAVEDGDVSQGQAEGETKSEGQSVASSNPA